MILSGWLLQLGLLAAWRELSQMKITLFFARVYK